jgi:predicted nucleotidyltransferase component of viral defense system
MHESILDEKTKQNLALLSQQEFIAHFYLAGGTACALHLGHRTSDDLDFFSKQNLTHFEMQNSLRRCGHIVVDFSDSQTLVGRFNKTKVSFFNYNYPLIREPQHFLNIKISSLEDIGCMKLDAISSRGSKRDFVDLYFILKKFNLSLKEFFRYFEQKYGRANYNIVHILKSLVYFDDADRDPELNMRITFSWENLKHFYITEIKRFNNF